ncbi:exodeoxyribonuclease III [Labrys monachus]|uniref:exodeoxyribonuclease III n=1 Tax=Labrys monachus TaxID=217067 RepID=UPI0027D82172|nr:exodeoxyribonuclease III [Labrys monachus]
MRIASWNVNSIRQRLPHLIEWLGDAAPDVVCLQEIKCLAEAFPTADIEAVGYNVAVHGQKTFNGVAILSKYPLEDVAAGLPGDDSDEQARYIEAVISTAEGALRVASVYLPNGNPVASEKYPYKLRWMDRLKARTAELLALEETFVLAGDYNIIPAPEDARNPADWVSDALFLLQSRAKFRELMALGITDAFRACEASPGHYTFWDYQAGAWQRDNGIRIDHLLLSPQAASRLHGCVIDKSIRGREKASDHVPVRCDLAI